MSRSLVFSDLSYSWIFSILVNLPNVPNVTNLFSDSSVEQRIVDPLFIYIILFAVFNHFHNI
jgi:hypothetical protein